MKKSGLSLDEVRSMADWVDYTECLACLRSRYDGMNVYCFGTLAQAMHMRYKIFADTCEEVDIDDYKDSPGLWFIECFW